MNLPPVVFSSLTIQDVKSLANRIEYRTSNMVSVEPVCAECKNKVIDCYNTYQLPEDNIKCWDTVGMYVRTRIGRVVSVSSFKAVQNLDSKCLQLMHGDKPVRIYKGPTILRVVRST